MDAATAAGRKRGRAAVAPSAAAVSAALGAPSRYDSEGRAAPAGGGSSAAAAAAAAAAGAAAAAAALDDGDDGGLLRARLLELLRKRGREGVTATEAPARLHVTAAELLPALAALTDERRLAVERRRRADGSEEQVYLFVEEERAARMSGLTPEDEAVLALVERAGNQALWVRTIKITTKLQQMQLNRIIKRLESRKLVKSVKSIAFKNRRMLMAYDLEPAKELTGGVWYSELQLDVEFINAIRSAVIKIMKEAGGTATPVEVAAKLKDQGVSNVPLKPSDVQQVMDSLVYEGWIDYEGASARRAITLHRPEAAMFPKRKMLMEEFGKKARARGGAGGGGGEDDEDGGDDGSEEDDDEGATDDLSRAYICLPRRPTAHADLLTTVPCGTCPVSKQCVPGGVVSPETCIYISHWLQW